MIDAGGTVSILSPNREQMTAHVQHLFGDCTEGVVELAWVDPSRNALDKGEMFSLDRLDDLVERAAEINSKPGFNVYIGAALRKEGTFPTARADDSDYLCTVAYYVDLDDPGVAEAAGERLKDCRPTFAVMTGLRPHARASLWWKLETPLYDAQQHINQMKALAAHFGGDRVVYNPSRVMRLGGSVAWPRKSGRVLEMTEAIQFRDNRPLQMLPGQVERAYPIALQAISGTLQAAPDRGVISGKLSTSKLLKDVTSGAQWHNQMVRLVGNWINRGFSDDEIIAFADHLRLDGYTIDQTIREISAAISGGRSKWNIPNPIIDIPDAQDLPTGPKSEPRAASSYVGIPPEREWIIEDWIPALTVTSLYGDGGMGKTLLAQQLGTACVTKTPWLGLQAGHMPVLAVLCEDDDDELHRRQASINASVGSLMHPGLDHLMLWSRVGEENILVNFDQKNVATPTPFYHELEAKLAAYGRPHLLILDNAADVFGGNEIIRAQVNAFVKSWLGAWIKKYQTTILLLAHPSAAGKLNGTGLSGSTAWNNAVRSRLFLDREKDADTSQRVLKRLKANYAASGDDQKIDIVWESGQFTTKPSQDTVDRIEHRAIKNQIVYIVEREWLAGAPLGGSRSNRKVRDVLPGLLKNFERGQVMKAFAELERDGVVSTQHGDTHRRGYKVIGGVDA